MICRYTFVISSQGAVGGGKSFDFSFAAKKASWHAKSARSGWMDGPGLNLLIHGRDCHHQYLLRNVPLGRNQRAEGASPTVSR